MGDAQPPVVRRWFGWHILALLVAASLAGCSAGARPADDATVFAAGGPAATTGPPAGAVAHGPRAAARWVAVATFAGTGDQQTKAFTILPDAIQWRVRLTCQGTAVFQLVTTPAPRRGGPIGTGVCPRGDGFAIHTGSIRLGVQTAGRWSAVVEQQVDTPLNEPPLVAMRSAVVTGEGSFYDLERSGKGTARLYQATDGRRFLRLENFETPVNTDLFIWLTDAAHPKDSATAFAAKRFVVGTLKSTVGNENYEIPKNVGIDIRSVVIWCQPVSIAYAAASLKGPG